MQGRDDGQHQLFDVDGLAGHMLPAGSVFALLAGHRHTLFPDDAFEDLFSSGRGRPSIPADVIASVMVLQTLNGLSDRETAYAVTFDLRWKAACGFALTETSFHPTVLTYWRRRLAARHGRPGPAGGHRGGGAHGCAAGDRRLAGVGRGAGLGAGRRLRWHR